MKGISQQGSEQGERLVTFSVGSMSDGTRVTAGHTYETSGSSSSTKPYLAAGAGLCCGTGANGSLTVTEASFASDDNKAVAAQEAVSVQAVGKWRARFVDFRLHGLHGLQESPSSCLRNLSRSNPGAASANGASGN